MDGDNELSAGDRFALECLFTRDVGLKSNFGMMLELHGNYGKPHVEEYKRRELERAKHLRRNRKLRHCEPDDPNPETVSITAEAHSANREDPYGDRVRDEIVDADRVLIRLGKVDPVAHRVLSAHFGDVGQTFTGNPGHMFLALTAAGKAFEQSVNTKWPGDYDARARQLAKPTGEERRALLDLARRQSAALLLNAFAAWNRVKRGD